MWRQLIKVNIFSSVVINISASLSISRQKMIRKIGLALALTILINVTFAQSRFDGFYGQVGIGYEGLSPTVSNSNVSSDGTSAPIGIAINSSSSFSGVITAGYMTSINKSFLMGMGAEFSPVKGRKTTYSASLPGYPIGTGTYNKENSYNIFLSPAAPIRNDGLIYGKFGYTGATLNDSFASVSINENYSGFSLGLGYKQIFDSGLYGFFEGNYMHYGNKTYSQTGTVPGYTITSTITIQGDIYNFLVGLGYKF